MLENHAIPCIWLGHANSHDAEIPNPKTTQLMLTQDAVFKKSLTSMTKMTINKNSVEEKTNTMEEKPNKITEVASKNENEDNESTAGDPIFL